MHVKQLGGWLQQAQAAGAAKVVVYRHKPLGKQGETLDSFALPVTAVAIVNRLEVAREESGRPSLSFYLHAQDANGAVLLRDQVKIAGGEIEDLVDEAAKQDPVVKLLTAVLAQRDAREQAFLEFTTTNMQRTMDHALALVDKVNERAAKAEGALTDAIEGIIEASMMRRESEDAQLASQERRAIISAVAPRLVNTAGVILAAVAKGKFPKVAAFVESLSDEQMGFIMSKLTKEQQIQLGQIIQALEPDEDVKEETKEETKEGAA